eukprot:gene16642-22742_t
MEVTSIYATKRVFMANAIPIYADQNLYEPQSFPILGPNAQLQDPELKTILNSLAPVVSIKKLHNHRVQHETEYLYRRRTPKGQLLRRFVSRKHWFADHHIMKLDTIRSEYFCSNLREDDRDHCRACRFCMRRKADRKQGRLPVMDYNSATPKESLRPFQRVHIDLTGPFPPTPDGNKYILVVKDSLTKWIELFAIPNKKPQLLPCVCVMRSFICRHGSPEIIISEQGTEFTAAIIIQQLLKLMGIKHIRTTPTHPEANNGQAEQHNHILKDVLSSYLSVVHGNDWDQHLSLVAYDYRTTVNQATGETPFSRRPTDIETFKEVYESYRTVSPFIAADTAKVLRFVWEHGANQITENVKEIHPRIRNKAPICEHQVNDYIFLKYIPRRFIRTVLSRNFLRFFTKWMSTTN